MANLDAEFNGQISRYDYKQVLAAARVQAFVRPVVVYYDAVNASGGYQPGTVLGQVTSGSASGQFGTYSSGGASGLNTAKCILLSAAMPASGGTAVGNAVYKGILYASALIGLDAGAITALGGRVVNDATGNSLFIF